MQEGLARRVLDPHPPPQRGAVRAVDPLERRLELQLHAQDRARDGAEVGAQLQVGEGPKSRAHAVARRGVEAQEGGDFGSGGVEKALERQAAVLQAREEVVP